MGDVSIVFQITPEDVDVDLSDIQKSIEGAVPSNANIRGFQIKPVAFGLKVLLMNVVVPDEGGGADRIQEIVQGLDKVSNVDVIDLTLI